MSENPQMDNQRLQWALGCSDGTFWLKQSGQQVWVSIKAVDHDHEIALEITGDLAKLADAVSLFQERVQ